MTGSTASKPTIKLTLPKKVVFSALTTLLFFVVFEFTLRVIGFASDQDTKDPFVGFSGLLPLMELSTNDKGEQILSTAQNKRHWFNAQSFPKIKKPGIKRVFCMGGSTTYGHPYWDSTSFPGWLREFLPIVDPSHEWEVINAGGISYASYRVAALMEELSQYEPDLFVVYSVHNEFLERRTYQNMFDTPELVLQTQTILSRTRIWALAHRMMQRGSPKLDVLSGEVDEILNHTVGPVDYHRDDDWRDQVLQHYETNLRRMVFIAKRAGAKIVFVTPAANEKNCSPFKSEPVQPISQSNIGGNEIDLRCAEDQYRLGQESFKAGRYVEAKRAFSKALNEDVCPLRAIDGIRIAIEGVVREFDLPMVDFEKKLRGLCEEELGHSIFGEEYFLDHVHPTVDVNRRLAFWIIEELQANEIVSGKSVTDRSLANPLLEVEQRVIGQIDDEAQAFARLNLAKVIHWAGKFEEAIPHARAVLKSIPTEPESRFILARCLKQLGQIDEALQEYEILFSDGVGYPRACFHFGQMLAEHGDLERAKAYLLMAILNDEKDAGAYFHLGLVHLRLKEFQFAVESFESSNRLYPDDEQTLLYLAEAKAGLARDSTPIDIGSEK